MNASFADFFEGVWSFRPFPWQERLARRVQRHGWPRVLDLPTGSGKTAALDIALYHLAMDGGRTAPRRIVLVVDRRVIVDQVGVRARRLHRALLKPPNAAVAEVAGALQRMVGHGSPLLETAVLRGATLRDDAWAQRPHVPVLAASTVDQVGSRLLFRGYGVSDSMKPVHAGLVGCDTLLLLDEVHLARPFADVLGQLDRLREPNGEIPRRFEVVQLSATPGVGADESFRLERTTDRNDKELGKRLGARKPITLATVPVRARDEDEAKRAGVAEEAAALARAMVDEGRRAVAVVVNRVDTARRIWAALESSEFDRVLLTGRMRPLDQQTQLEAIQDRVLAGREEDSDVRPLVLATTQCIEAGADFDFDGMVTECASLDALRQRFGRLDRRGDQDWRDKRSRGVVLCRSDLQESSDADPVYGRALSATWQWLNELQEEVELDFGIDALEPHLTALGEGIDGLRAMDRDAPVVLPAYLDQWVQTNPAPHADPDVSLFLHGIPEDKRSILPDVQVVWRADITERDLERATSGKGDAATRLHDQLGATPPGALEALSIPIWAFERWLARSVDAAAPAAPDDIADVDGQPGPDRDSPRLQPGHRVIVWRGRRRMDVVQSGDVQPGQLVVLPAAYGGIGIHKTFEPALGGVKREEVHPVEDLGDAVQLLQRGRPSLRLDPTILKRWVGASFVEQLPLKPGDAEDEWELDEEADIRGRLLDAVDFFNDSEIAHEPRWLAAIRKALRQRRPRFVSLVGADGKPRWLALGRPVKPIELQRLLSEPAEAGIERPAPTDATTDGDDGAFTGANSELDEHLIGVAAKARLFSEAASLPSPIVNALWWAGRIHDVGKVDRRFQLWLHNGDEVSVASSGVVLAKSTTPKQDRAARRLARERAGYPQGQRHELVSLDLAEHSTTLRQRVEADEADWELVLHLVASHHGWCRPVAPPVSIPEEAVEDVGWDVEGVRLSGTTGHRRARMDSGVVERFWRLVRRYGWHELAYLEAVLRLADHRRSAEEQEG